MWSRVETRSTTVVSPTASSSPASSTHDFTCPLATGSSYSMPRSGPRVDAERQVAVGRFDTRRPSRRAARRSGPSARAESDSSPEELEPLPCLPCEDARDETDERSRVAAVDRFGGRAQAAQAEAADPQDVVSLLLDLHAERAHRAQASTRCPPERPKPVTTVSPSQIAPISTARWEIDLSPGTATAPRRLMAGATTVTDRPVERPERLLGQSSVGQPGRTPDGSKSRSLTSGSAASRRAAGPAARRPPPAPRDARA